MKNRNYHKIAIIGAGNVGSAAAYAMDIKQVAAEIVLIDRNEKKEEGEVMDIADGLCFVETGCVKGSDFRDAASADIIVITAGARQKPGETRLDLVEKNKSIMTSIFKKVGKVNKNAKILVISNPVDVLTQHIQKITKLPANQVFGSGTCLDTARLHTALADKFQVSAQDVSGFVMGEHGDSEFVAWSTVSIGGVPITKVKGFNKRIANKIEKDVRKEAYEIINRKGATYYGIGLVIADIAEAILYNQQKILPVTSVLNKWNGLSGVALGVPSIVGADGIKDYWPIPLSKEEKKKLQASAKVIREYL